MSATVTGFARDWLAARRDELNGRFRVAARRWPALDGAAVLELAAELLPPLAGPGEEGAADLLSSAWDLILLHAGRGTLAPRGGGANAGISALLRRVFPAVRPLLLQRPRALPASLSNAVENLGARGGEFAERLGEVAPGLTHAGELEDAAAVAAWRLGEARLRAEALRAAGRIPPRAVLAALRLGTWPEAAAGLVVAALAADAWRRPEEAVSEETLAALDGASAEKLESLRRGVAAPPRARLGAWRPAGAVGDFSGFGGAFEEPPLLVSPPSEGSRHRFFALSGDSGWRVEADVWGWTCRADPSAAAFPVREVRARGVISSLLFGGDDGSPALRPDGTLAFGGESAVFPGLRDATSFVSGNDFLAATLPDSHRIRVYAPHVEPA